MSLARIIRGLVSIGTLSLAQKLIQRNDRKGNQGVLLSGNLISNEFSYLVQARISRKVMIAIAGTRFVAKLKPLPLRGKSLIS